MASQEWLSSLPASLSVCPVLSQKKETQALVREAGDSPCVALFIQPLIPGEPGTQEGLTLVVNVGYPGPTLSPLSLIHI